MSHLRDFDDKIMVTNCASIDTSAPDHVGSMSPKSPLFSIAQDNSEIGESLQITEQPTHLFEKKGNFEQKLVHIEQRTEGLFELMSNLAQKVNLIDAKLEQLLQRGNGSDRSLPTLSAPSTCYSATQFGVDPDCATTASTSSFSIANTLTNMAQGIQMVPESISSDTGPVYLPLPGNHLTTADDLSYLPRRSWSERFQELRHYKQVNGNCNVPQVYETGLGAWVSSQRAQYKRYTTGKSSSITAERVQRLEHIGFSWSLRKRLSWEERFLELKHFSETHGGSCNVPNDRCYKQLWQWSQNQRQAYRRGSEGKGPLFAPGRVQLMESIGFQWSNSSAPISVYHNHKEESILMTDISPSSSSNEEESR